METMTSNDVGDTYVDRKRYLWMLSLVFPAIPIFGAIVAAKTGHGIWMWTLVILFYAVLPVLDHVVGEDSSNPPESVVPRLQQDRYYRWLTYLTVPVHYATLVLAAWIAGTWDLGVADYLGLSLSAGLAGGLAINTGHELGHKPTGHERWLAKAALAVCGYGHFLVEHNRGHHRDVATPEDPASARMGESLYRFALREVPGALRRAVAVESQRLAQQGKHGLSWHNEIIQPLVITVAVYTLLIVAFGPPTIWFLIIQSVFAYWQLTSANYVEHYGLLRQKQASGGYERCQPRHSWNTNRVVSNVVLFHLQRHSDHHAHASRRYQALRHYDEAPQLPSGYPGMFVLAMVPPLWFRVMDSRVVENVGGDLDQVNTAPHRRAALQIRYGA